ncbi:unnamed protein product [Rotaria magnacalcarata]
MDTSTSSLTDTSTSPLTDTSTSSPTDTSTSPPSCFAGDSWLQMIDGRQQKIDRLHTGDKLIAFDGTNLTTGEMILMLDQNAYGEEVQQLVSILAPATPRLQGISLFSNSTDEQQQQQQQQLTFPPGKNSWPFSFSLPEFLPPSATQLKSYSQYIEYSIDFEIMRPRLCRRNIEKTFVIPVQNSLRIAADRQVQDQKENQNVVSLRGYLENNVVVTGTTFTLHFEVDNPNGSTINKISTYLVQNRQFAASPKEQFIINEHKIKDPQRLQKNQVKDKIDFILPTTLPATCSYHPPSWLPVQDIDIDYYVLIQLHMNRSIEDIVLELPVIVTAVTEPTIDIPPSYESIFSTRQ